MDAAGGDGGGKAGWRVAAAESLPASRPKAVQPVPILVRDPHHLVNSGHQEAEPEIPGKSRTSHDQVKVVQYNEAHGSVISKNGPSAGPVAADSR